MGVLGLLACIISASERPNPIWRRPLPVKRCNLLRFFAIRAPSACSPSCRGSGSPYGEHAMICRLFASTLLIHRTATCTPGRRCIDPNTSIAMPSLRQTTPCPSRRHVSTPVLLPSPSWLPFALAFAAPLSPSCRETLSGFLSKLPGLWRYSPMLSATRKIRCG